MKRFIWALVTCLAVAGPCWACYPTFGYGYRQFAPFIPTVQVYATPVYYTVPIAVPFVVPVPTLSYGFGYGYGVPYGLPAAPAYSPAPPALTPAPAAPLPPPATPPPNPPAEGIPALQTQPTAYGAIATAYGSALAVGAGYGYGISSYGSSYLGVRRRVLLDGGYGSAVVVERFHPIARVIFGPLHAAVRVAVAGGRAAVRVVAGPRRVRVRVK